MTPTEGKEVEKRLCCSQFRFSPCLSVAKKKTLTSERGPLLSEWVVRRQPTPRGSVDWSPRAFVKMDQTRAARAIPCDSFLVLQKKSLENLN